MYRDIVVKTQSFDSSYSTYDREKNDRYDEYATTLRDVAPTLLRDAIRSLSSRSGEKEKEAVRTLFIKYEDYREEFKTLGQLFVAV